MTAPDTIVIGGGLVGAAIAFGLQNAGVKTLMLDEGDVAFRAARGNFGLVWVQSKGIHFPPYAQWTWASSQGWPQLSHDLTALTGIDLAYTRPGGVEVCLSDAELGEKEQEIKQLQSHASHITYRMLDHTELAKMAPGIGPDVVGGCYCPADGHANPLALLRALHTAFRAQGGQVETGEKATDITPNGMGFTVKTARHSHDCGQVVIAAGLGTQKLAAMVGMHVPVRPQRGQNLVTERMKPFLDLPLSGIRQTAEGSVQLGDTNEEVGYDERTTPAGQAEIAARAVRVFPHLARARVVRAWAALRVMSPDGAPVYAQSQAHPGAFAAICHSGVTLAAAHVQQLATAVATGGLPDKALTLGPERFADA